MQFDSDIFHILTLDAVYGFLTGLVIYFWKKVFP